MGRRRFRVQPLPEVKQPVLVANGSNDVMVPTINSFTMAQLLPNAQLIVYPDSGHGFLFLYPDLFVDHACGFYANRAPAFTPGETARGITCHCSRKSRLRHRSRRRHRQASAIAFARDGASVIVAEYRNQPGAFGRNRRNDPRPAERPSSCGGCH